MVLVYRGSQRAEGWGLDWCDSMKRAVVAKESDVPGAGGADRGSAASAGRRRTAGSQSGNGWSRSFAGAGSGSRPRSRKANRSRIRRSLVVKQGRHTGDRRRGRFRPRWTSTSSCSVRCSVRGATGRCGWPGRPISTRRICRG